MKSHIGRSHSGVTLDSVEINEVAAYEGDHAEREHNETSQAFDSSFDEVQTDSLLLQTSDMHCDEGDSLEDNSRELGSSSPFTQMQRSIALFILTLKEKYKVTQAAIDFTVTQMKSNIDHVVNNLHLAVDSETREMPGLSEDDVARITAMFSSFSNPFTDLQTHYFQSKFFEENFGLIVSTENVTELTLVVGTIFWEITKIIC